MASFFRQIHSLEAGCYACTDSQKVSQFELERPFSSWVLRAEWNQMESLPRDMIHTGVSPGMES